MMLVVNIQQRRPSAMDVWRTERLSSRVDGFLSVGRRLLDGSMAATNGRGVFGVLHGSE